MRARTVVSRELRANFALARGVDEAPPFPSRRLFIEARALRPSPPIGIRKAVRSGGAGPERNAPPLHRDSLPLARLRSSREKWDRRALGAAAAGERWRRAPPPEAGAERPGRGFPVPFPFLQAIPALRLGRRPPLPSPRHEGGAGRR